MYVEFAGLPGAGKTLLSKALKKRHQGTVSNMMLREEALSVCIRRKTDFPLFRFAQKMPLWLWRPKPRLPYLFSDFVKISSAHLEFISLISRHLADANMEEALKESVWRSLLKSLSEVSLLSSQATGKERILMDEAIFQRCFTLFAYTDTDVSDGLVSRYADLAPIATHVIWIDTSPETSIGRLKERYLNHPSPYAPYSDELLAQFARGRKALSILSEVLRHRGHTVYRVNGDLGKDEVIQQASRHLSDIFSLPSKALSA